MQDLNSFIERITLAHTTTMRKLGPELAEVMNGVLTGPQFFILHLLSKKERWMVTEIAERMSVKPSAITVMIDRLKDHGFVERQRDEQDRRVVFIKITDGGRQTLAEAVEKRKQIVMKYLQQLTPEEQESLVSIYEKMARIVTGQ